MKESINLIPSVQARRVSLVTVVDKSALYLFWVVLLSEAFFVFLLIFRVVLDRDIAKIKGSLEQKKAVITATADVEKTIRSIQLKLNVIKSLRQDRPSFLKAATYIPTLIPEDVSLLILDLSFDKGKIEAKTGTGTSFAKLIENISHSAKFTDLTLTQSSFNNATGFYTFTFEFAIKEGIFR